MARLLVALVAVVVLAAAGGLLVWLGAGPLPDPEGCTAEVDGTEVELTTTQSENAALIAAVAVRRGLPARAVSIALATAFQESKLRNIDYGDRDSVGLFQQRPSQGWGTEEQLLDPTYAANAFYDELVEVEGYEEMRITEAAQAVQRSGFPEAYEEHAEGARALASALTGWSPARFSCVASDPSVSAESEGPSGLTPRAERVRERLVEVFGELPLGGFEPGGVDTGHMEGSAHYEGRAIDVFVRPVNDANKRRGWAIASYLVAHAVDLELDHVIFDGRIWSAGRRSEQGWREYSPSSAEDAEPRTRAILLHRDHVHVDVAEGD
ncbi:hypothetical protein [Nocardioides caldifontis]|uniref:hypothetical protein n=1 Tax=Nocardioides caldifontis TaxID=2588938 RepID=UPI001EF039AE